MYVEFSLPRDISRFPEDFSLKVHTKCFFERQKRVLRISNIFRQSHTELEVINYHPDEKPDKTASKSYFREVQSACPLFTVSLPSLDNLVHFIGHTAIIRSF